MNAVLSPLVRGHGQAQEQRRLEPLLAALSHTLADEKLRDLGESEDKWKKAAQSAYDEALIGGELLADARDLFSRAYRADGTSAVRKQVLHGREKVWAVRRNSRSFILDLCRFNSSHSVFGKAEDAFVFDWTAVDFYGKPLLPHLFDRADLIFAIGALRSNALKHNSDFQLFYEEQRSSTSYWQIVHWLQKGEVPWKTRNELIQVVGASAGDPEKGISRGLPKALLFAIENRCHELSTKFNGAWHPLISPDLRHNLAPQSFACCMFEGAADYGWRFVFKGELTKDAGRQERATRKVVSTAAAKPPPTKLKLFLVDDLKLAGERWFGDVTRAIDDGFHGGRPDIIPLTLSGSNTGAQIVDFFFEEIKKASEKGDFALVTDSNFSDFRDGGARLIRKLCNDVELNKKLYRAVIFSDTPEDLVGSSVRVQQTGRIDLCPKTGLSADDAKTVVHFISYGKLRPLDPLLEMIQRLCATGTFLFRDEHPGDGDELIQIARALSRGVGGSLPAPFSLAWLTTFGPRILESEIDRNLVDEGERKRALCIRSVLCPAESVHAARELLDALLTKRNPVEGGGGAIRLFWELGTSSEASPLNDEVLDSDARERFRREVLCLRQKLVENRTWESRIWHDLWRGARGELAFIQKLSTLLRYA